jgi:hypothetical protein
LIAKHINKSKPAYIFGNKAYNPNLLDSACSMMGKALTSPTSIEMQEPKDRG